MRRPALIFILTALILFACNDTKVKIPKYGYYQDQKENEDGTFSIKEYNNGILIKQYDVKDSTYNGEMISYYNTGELRATYKYLSGKLDGDVCWYYESGKVFEIIPYKNNKIEGIRKTYYENGTLRSELPYIDNHAQAGLKEYYENGKIIEQPELKIQEIDHLIYENLYILEISLSKKSKKVKYYQVFDKGTDQEKEYLIKSKNGVCRIEIDVLQGEYFMEDFFVRAKTTSKLNNRLVIDKVKRVAVHNQ